MEAGAEIDTMAEMISTTLGTETIPWNEHPLRSTTAVGRPHNATRKSKRDAERMLIHTDSDTETARDMGTERGKRVGGPKSKEKQKKESQIVGQDRVIDGQGAGTVGTRRSTLPPTTDVKGGEKSLSHT